MSTNRMQKIFGSDVSSDEEPSTQPTTIDKFKDVFGSDVESVEEEIPQQASSKRTVVRRYEEEEETRVEVPALQAKGPMRKLNATPFQDLHSSGKVRKFRFEFFSRFSSSSSFLLISF